MAQHCTAKTVMKASALSRVALAVGSHSSLAVSPTVQTRQEKPPGCVHTSLCIIRWNSVAFCTPALVHSVGTGQSGTGDASSILWPFCRNPTFRPATQLPLTPRSTPATTPSRSHRHASHPDTIKTGGAGNRSWRAVAEIVSSCQEATVTKRNDPVTRNSDATYSRTSATVC
jgi:hypothetical protein